MIGKGGREHALCWKLRQSPQASTIYCVPGNAGTREIVDNVTIDPNDTRELIRFAKNRAIGLTIVGPEEPLVEGLVDAFQREGLRIFGPKREAAELEGSKVFAKELMRQAGIPTADFRVFRGAPDAEQYILSREVALTIRSRGRSMIRGTHHARTALEAIELIEKILDPKQILPGGSVEVEIEARGRREYFKDQAVARQHVLARPIALVIKADGLAAGKGVFVCRDLAEALHAIDTIMVRRQFGRAGDRVIIEERLDGVEASILALTDGRTIVPLESSQDYKRAFDGDEGPNTGGMGAFSPTPKMTPELTNEVEREILVPIVHAMKRARRAFRGVIYAGLMLTNQGPKVLEFNVRFGDPECQAILLRLKSDLLEALNAVVDEKLDTVELEWDSRPAITVVMASEGYPGKYERDKPINGLGDASRIDDVQIFHAGTTVRKEPQGPPRIVTDGGRVLNVSAIGNTIAEARDKALKAASMIRFSGAWYRRDIGERVGN